MALGACYRELDESGPNGNVQDVLARGDDATNVWAALEAGCDGFVPKPVHVKPLGEAVRRLLARGAAVDAQAGKLAD